MRCFCKINTSQAGAQTSVTIKLTCPIHGRALRSDGGVAIRLDPELGILTVTPPRNLWTEVAADVEAHDG